jgi:hypothetical protein
MATSHQIEHVIKRAEKQVALHGFENGVNTSVIMLAGFGYLAHEIKESKMSMKKAMALAGTVGLAAGNVIMLGILKVLSS